MYIMDIICKSLIKTITSGAGGCLILGERDSIPFVSIHILFLRGSKPISITISRWISIHFPAMLMFFTNVLGF